MIDKSVSTNTKNKIFLTAAKLFSSDGFYKVSVREICSSAGVTKPVLYYYFKDKESLLYELVEETHRLAAIVQKKYISEDKEFLQNLRGIGEVYKDFMKSHPDFARFSAFVNIMSAPQRVKDFKYEHAKREFEKLSIFFKKGQNLGILPETLEPDLLVRNFIGTILIYISEDILTNYDFDTFEKNVDNFLEFWIDKFTISN